MRICYINLLTCLLVSLSAACKQPKAVNCELCNHCMTQHSNVCTEADLVRHADET